MTKTPLNSSDTNATIKYKCGSTRFTDEKSEIFNIFKTPMHVMPPNEILLWKWTSECWEWFCFRTKEPGNNSRKTQDQRKFYKPAKAMAKISSGVDQSTRKQVVSYQLQCFSCHTLIKALIIHHYTGFISGNNWLKKLGVLNLFQIWFQTWRLNSLTREKKNLVGF